MRPTFNLVDEPFIPCRSSAGPMLLNLRDTLAKAHDIAEIADPSPLTTFSLYRFLLVVVHRCLDAVDWTVDNLPMDRVGAYLDKLHDRFDLFDAERPFLQRPVEGAPGSRPVSDLIAELPTDTNINHSRHALDDAMVLCAVCCAHGLLRLAPFCGQGGQGKAPSINAPPPAYFWPLGRTLFETLRLNAAALPRVPGDGSLWEDARPSSDRIGPLEAFTWEPRTVQFRPAEADGTACTLCGRRDLPIVREIVFQKGRDRGGAKVREWRDPHAAYAEEPKVRMLVPPETVQRTDAAGGFWRQTAAVVLGGEPFKCAAVESLGDAARRVRVVSLHTRKAKVLHDHAEEWIVSELTATARAEFFQHLDWLHDGLEEIGDGLKSRDEFERHAEVLYRRVLAGGSIDEFYRSVQALVTNLTRPPADPCRPLAFHAADRMAQTTAARAFPIPEAAS